MESKGFVSSNKYGSIEAVITYDGRQLIISSKPIWVRMFFGVVGEALAPAKERFRVSNSDVVSASFSSTKKGKAVVKITTIADSFDIILNYTDELATALKFDLWKVGNEK